MGKLGDLLTPTSIERLDLDAVVAYNVDAAEKYRLRTELGPYAYEGDLDAARVAVLLSNPGFGDESTLESHTFRRDGWPLAGLHPDAPPGTLKWHRRLLGPLTQLIDAQIVAQRVVKLELTPWASIEMDKGLRLPSRQLVLGAAAELARRGTILVVMRAERFWLESPEVANSPSRYRVKNWRSASLSPGNLTAEGWNAIAAAVSRP